MKVLLPCQVDSQNLKKHQQYAIFFWHSCVITVVDNKRTNKTKTSVLIDTSITKDTHSGLPVYCSVPGFMNMGRNWISNKADDFIFTVHLTSRRIQSQLDRKEQLAFTGNMNGMVDKMLAISELGYAFSFFFHFFLTCVSYKQYLSCQEYCIR